jgi:hypothetical protein
MANSAFDVSGTSVAAASQAEQETGSSTTVFVSPGRQQYHASAIKVWVSFAWAAGVPTINASYNVTSLTDDTDGTVTIVFATDFSSVNYVWAAGNTDTGFASFTDSNSANAAGSKQIAYRRYSTGNATDLNSQCSFLAAGDQ